MSRTTYSSSAYSSLSMRYKYPLRSQQHVRYLNCFVSSFSSTSLLFNTFDLIISEQWMIRNGHASVCFDCNRKKKENETRMFSWDKRMHKKGFVVRVPTCIFPASLSGFYWFGSFFSSHYIMINRIFFILPFNPDHRGKVFLCVLVTYLFAYWNCLLN